LLLVAVIVTAGSDVVHAQEAIDECVDVAAPHAERRLFLLTMAPGPEVWSVYGHTGIWVSEPGDSDLIYNFGVVNESRPNLMRDTLNGTLEFYLGVRSLDAMLRYYGGSERTVIAQRLDLTPSMEEELVVYLREEALPHNRDYLYHWRDANCSSRVRDLLDEVTGGVNGIDWDEVTEITARDEVLRHLEPYHLWWFMMNYAIADDVDQPLTRSDLMFLPDRLFFEADRMIVPLSGNRSRPLVSETCVVYRGDHDFVSLTPTNRDALLCLSGAALAGLYLLLGGWARRGTVGRVVFSFALVPWSLLTGSLGLAGVWLWLNSDVEAFWRNVDLFGANPLSLLLLPSAALLALGRGLKWVRRVVTGLAALALVSLVLLPFIDQQALGTTGLFLLPLVAIAYRVRQIDS
jgi:hypothetical protein